MHCSLRDPVVGVLATPRPAHLPPPAYLFPPCMARDRTKRSRQQTQGPRCPSCGKRFADILRHLNHRQSKCVDWFNTTVPHPGPSPHHREHPADDATGSPTPHNDFSNTEQSPPPSPPQLDAKRVEFSGAAKTYGRAKTFMDRFNDDKYSGFRATNIYYPFAGKNEWELSSFLLSSGLSMRKIDDFLRLKMVIILFFISSQRTSSQTKDPGCQCLVFYSKGPLWQSGVTPQSPRLESQEDQHHRLWNP